MITPAYRILKIEGRPVLLCLRCDRYSYHPDDITNRYCGHCRCFLATWEGEEVALRRLLAEAEIYVRAYKCQCDAPDGIAGASRLLRKMGQALTHSKETSLC